MSTKRCPRCRSDELGENRLVSECRDIHSGEVLSRREAGWDSPKYTCMCGYEFDVPWIEGATTVDAFTGEPTP